MSSTASPQGSSEACSSAPPGHTTGPSNTDTDYLTMEELATLDQNTNVVVDMSTLFKKNCVIYTVAYVVLGGVDSCRLALACDNPVVGNYRKAVVHTTSTDPEALFHAMNTGEDKEIEEWKLFSAHCLLIATHRYLVHKKPFPVRLEGNPSLHLGLRNRSRIHQYWSLCFAEAQADISGWKGCELLGSSGRVSASFSTEELGSEDPVWVNVSQYLKDVPLMVHVNREIFVRQFNSITTDMKVRRKLEHHEAVYEQLVKRCSGYDEAYVRTHYTLVSVYCLELVVLDRLLHGKPLPLVQESERTAMTMLDEPDAHQDCDPTISSGKGGYEVNGELIEGAGNTTVYLSFQDVPPHMVVFVDMSQELGMHPVIKVKHGVVMEYRKTAATGMSGFTQEQIKTAMIRQFRDCSSINPRTYEHAQAGSEEANITWKRHELTCMLLVTSQSAAYNKPIRLCVEPNSDVGSHDPEDAAAVAAMRKLCLRHGAKE